MNKATFIVFVTILLCAMNHVLCGVEEFFKNLPGEIEKAFSSAWNGFKAAVKKPVRVRRLGSARRKTTTTTTTTTTEKVFKQSFTPQQVIARVQLPLLFPPEWRGLEHWRRLQIPNYALMKVPAFSSRRRMLHRLAQHYIDPYATTLSTNISSLTPAPATRTPLTTTSDTYDVKWYIN